MPTFILTAKLTMPLNGGMRIEKGQQFEVNLPWNHQPFDSIQSRDAVIRRLALEGIDIKGHESCLSKANFDVRDIK